MKKFKRDMGDPNSASLFEDLKAYQKYVSQNRYS